MFTILTRTSNRPNYFARCRQSVKDQTIQAYHIVSTDDPTDTYPEGDKIVQVEPAIGRGHNLYFNTMRLYVPSEFPFIIHLDDDDRFSSPFVLEIIRDHIQHSGNLILWKVRAPDRLIPERVGQHPVFGEISGIGFAVHVKHWINWQSVPGGDFLVIDHYYRKLKPVWIDTVLTEFQTGAGNGLKMDI